MSSMEASKQLSEIDRELSEIGDQLKALRQRQAKLREKKLQIERALSARSEEQTASSASWESDGFGWSAAARHSLRETFKLADFRPLQRAAVNALLSGEDVLLVASTGSGKSLVYQLPAALSEGVSLVVSPLVSLIEDQILSLRRLNIDAAALTQSATKQEVQRVQKALTGAVAASSLRLLYVTPEKLAKSKRLMAQLEKCHSAGRLKLIAIDEVHCCSQWGHDFRPDYKFLCVLRRQFSGVPMIGLTATATERVLDDVRDMLGLKGALVFRASFDRPNLFYDVRQKPSGKEAVIDEVCRFIRSSYHEQSGIVYCFSKRETHELVVGLRERGVKCATYHADMSADDRSSVHQRWIGGHYHVIVATIAFGMGIDKPDVRFVIHHSVAKSMENYYQESGRAGRDGRPATCLLYYSLADVFRQSSMVCTEKTGLENLYAMLAYCLKSECCRAVIARHFGEPLADTACGGCVVCSNQAGHQSSVVDAKVLARGLVEAAAAAAADGARQTALKLVNALVRRPEAAGVTRADCEALLARLLLDGYLREDFHFTPYSIISYVVPGHRRLPEDEPFELRVDGSGSEGESKARRKRAAPPKKNKRGKRAATAANVVDLCAEDD